MAFDKPDSLATRASLLERLKNLDDQGSWQEFYATYRRLLFGFALRHGLTETEAEEVVQETVITVARNLPEFQYNPGRCAFKTWLLRLTVWRIQDQLRKRRPECETIHRQDRDTDRTGTIERIPTPDDANAATIWDVEWEKHLFDRALERVKAVVDERRFQIFDLYALQGWPASEVARSLGVSRTRVYVTKHRITRLLKAEAQRLAREVWRLPNA